MSTLVVFDYTTAKAKMKRLPEPVPPKRVRAVLSEAELLQVEDAAHLCRLSVAAWVRVALIDASRNPERAEEWKRIANTILSGEPEKRKPGRPKGTTKKKD